MGRGAVAKGAPHPSTSKAEELREMLQRVDNLRRELEGTEECRIEGGMSHVKWRNKNQQWAMLPDEAAFQQLATKSNNPAGQQKKPSALPAVDSKSLLTSGGHNNFQRTMQKEDALGLPWAAVQDVPPLEITRLGSPCGPFWDHMRPFLYDRGAYVFPWHLNWNEQCPELKARFIYRLRQLYPGAWEAKEVLAQLGNTLRERRNRLKKRFKIYSNPKAVPRPKGCTLESWEQIHRDLRDPKKMAKASLCKAKADERVASAISPFSHRCGRGGYRAIIARFEDAFNRPPSGFEINYARIHGWAGLEEKTRLQVGTVPTGKEVASASGAHPKRQRRLEQRCHLPSVSSSRESAELLDWETSSSDDDGSRDGDEPVNSD